MTATLDESTADTRTGEDLPATEPPRPPRPVPAALAPWHDPHPRLAWLSTAVLIVIAGLTRFWALGSPPGPNIVPKNGMNFDEVYYAVEAQEILRFGYEDNRGYMFIVHPPLGKLLIALSEKLWDGDSSQYLTNSLGWRIAPALAGCLGVIMVSRITRRMMRSTLFGFIAGLLMAMEGLSLVLARTAILDIFLQTFVVAAFGALVVDRDAMRARLAGLIADGVDLGDGLPTLGPRPWRLVAGVCFGLACAVKWTGLSFFVVFGVLSVLWDWAAFRSAGVPRRIRATLRRSVLPGLGSLGLAPAAAYLLTYLGWFTGENSWNRHWADTHGPSWLPGPIRSLAWNHLDAYRFHEHLDSAHPYASNPWSWWVLGRPVDFYYNGSEKTCGASACSREVLLIGTPLLWWAFLPMALWLAWHWFTTRDWRAGAVWGAIVAGWLVWFLNLKRTMFLFYTAPLVPFLIIGVTLALGILLGPMLTTRESGPLLSRAAARRRWGIAGGTVFLTLVIVDFAWMWPIFTGGLLTYDDWHAHMWLPSWV